MECAHFSRAKDSANSKQISKKAASRCELGQARQSNIGTGKEETCRRYTPDAQDGQFRDDNHP